MQIVRTAGNRLAIEPHLALLANSVTVFVRKTINVGRRTREQLIAKSEYAFGERELVSDDAARIELAISVMID